MATFHVRFECTAAVSVDVAIDAADEYEARHEAERRFDCFRQQQALIGIAEGLCKPDPEAVKGYAQESGLPFVRVSMELDENGFETVDVDPVEETQP